MLAQPAAAIEFCSGRDRVTCVVDGDTVWIEGEKIRLANIDAPEPAGRCVEERIVGARATVRLAELLASGELRIEREGVDRYGRTLATLKVDDVDVGAVLITEGLARRWKGSRENWC